MFVAMDAPARLRELSLTGAVHITGSGLDPLRASSCLMKLDLSLVGRHENPKLMTTFKLSEEAVLPILLDHIHAEEGPSYMWKNHNSHSLICIRLPHIWSKGKSPALKKFISKCNESRLEGEKIMKPPYRKETFYCANCANYREEDKVFK